MASLFRPVIDSKDFRLLDHWVGEDCELSRKKTKVMQQKSSTKQNPVAHFAQVCPSLLLLHGTVGLRAEAELLNHIMFGLGPFISLWLLLHTAQKTGG